ncbi:MAG: hypothetical protein AB1403_26625, partial [Candidatus Riflebacteria bacterium]
CLERDRSLPGSGSKTAGKEKILMNCEEFRMKIIAEDQDLSALETHLQSCSSCSAWLERELATPPEGLSAAEWNNATARCMPDALPIESSGKDNDPSPQDQTMKGSFFNGLKYGLVFGLSIITGFAVLELMRVNPTVDSSKKVEIASFMEVDERKLPDFIEKDFSDVTFFDYHDSKIISFVENEKIPSFFEETQEEELWNDRDSG